MEGIEAGHVAPQTNTEALNLVLAAPARSGFGRLERGEQVA
jgi:hypothetical protein